MIDDGLFDRFPCDRVFGIHNWPALPAGVAATRAGAIMAAADKFEVTFEGKGAHAALPNLATDTIGAATHFAMQLKTLVAQCAPIDAMAVLSVTRIQAGHTHNVLPSTALVGGTVRTFDPGVQDRIEASLRRAAEGSAMMTGTDVTVIYDRYYPATINDAAVVDGVIEALEGVCPIHRADAPALTSEDFSFMLQARPGAYIWLGQGPAGGDGMPLHHPKFDFNDDILGAGVTIHVTLARHFLRAI
jgi:hippurate hydrolase